MKKKTLKKTLAFLMTAAMALSVAGCGGSNEEDSGDQQPTKSAEATNWESPEKSAELSGNPTNSHPGAE